jgi:hypothetical protein
MIITEPNDFVAEVHDRMRVILARNSFAKGALQNHICGFESCMPSQPVRSLLFDFRLRAILIGIELTGRRLPRLLAADAVGYSRIMREDEPGRSSCSTNTVDR